METKKSMRTMETKKPQTDWQWFKSLKWWQKLIFIDFAVTFTIIPGIGLEPGTPVWPLFLIVGNFGLCVHLLNKYVPVPPEE